MKQAKYKQLTAVTDYLYNSLRSDVILTRELDCSPDEICAAKREEMAFVASKDGIAVYGAELPCIAVFPKKASSEFVHGSKGFEVELGVQYLCKAHQPDPGETLEARVTHMLHLVWWRVCEYLQTPTTIMDDNGIYRLYPMAAEFLPPMENSVRGFDGSASMSYKYPPYEVAERTLLTSANGEIEIPAGYHGTDYTVESTSDGFQT
jgi:hypothetical protein